jgi:glycine/D-amino acid oxidase-like deaminating enzyme
MTAYHILKSSPEHERPNVVLLDARQLCSGATGRNGGHAKIKVATLAQMKDDSARNEMQAYVLSVLADLKHIVDAEQGLSDECEFEMRRTFDVFQDEEEVTKVKSVYDGAVKSGESWTRNVTWVGADMVEQVTSIKGAVGAFSSPAVSLWPYKFVAGLLERMVNRYPGKFNVQMNTPVTALSADNVLATPRGLISAEKVVLATNAWTAGLVPSFTGTITPVRGMASHHVPSTPVRPHLSNTYNIYFAPDAHGPTGVDYLNPRPNGSIVVGGGNWFYNQRKSVWYDNFDDSTRFPESVEAHWDTYMQSTFHGWESSKATPELVWTGIMGYTSDEKPHVGRVPGSERQWMLAGFNGGGMAVIATAARAVAEMVVKGKGFEDVREEFGLLEGFGTGVERLVGEYGKVITKSGGESEISD